jgi:hypothetical protein
MSTQIGMSLEAIKAAVSAGRTVHYQSRLYVVEHDSVGQWLIRCTANDSCIGLTWRDGVTLNGDPWHFFIGETTDAAQANG